MNVLNWRHPEVGQNQNTALVQQANAGDTTLTVINTKGISTNKLLLVGTYGSEDAEIVKVHASTSPTDTVITLAAALKFSHSSDTPVTLLDYDQIEVYRASAKGGSYSLVTTIDITPDEEATNYKDTAGSVTDYYKIKYKNSIDSSVSGFSAEIPAGGFDEDTLAGMTDYVLRQFSKQSEKILDRDDIRIWLNEGYRILINRIIDLGIDYYIKYGSDGSGALISFVSGQRAYDLPSDFLRPRRFLFTYDGVNYYPANPMDRSMDYPTANYYKTKPLYHFEHKKIIPKPKPTASTGGILPIYAYMPARMANDDDTPDLPLGYTKNPINHALRRVFESDNKFDVAKYYGDNFENESEMMLSEIKKRTPEMPQFVGMFGEGLEDDDNDGFVLPS